MDHRYQHIDRPEVALEGSIPVLEVGSGFVFGPNGNRFLDLICFFARSIRASASVIVTNSNLPSRNRERRTQQNMLIVAFRI